MSKIFTALVVALLSFTSVSVVQAHGGGTDSYGCHNDNKNGGRHCH